MFDILITMEFADHIDRALNLTNDELTAELRQIELDERALNVRRSALLAVAETNNTPADDGHASTMGWLVANTNCSRGDAIRARRLAKMMNHLPDVANQYTAGTIGTSQAHRFATALSRTNTGPLLASIDRSALITSAQYASFEEFATTLKGWEALADVDAKKDDDQANHEGRHGHVSETDTGLSMRFGGGDPIVAAEATAIFDEYCEEQFAIDAAVRDESDASTAALPRTADQRRFDAMIQILRDAANTTARRSPAADVVVNVVVSQDVFENTLAYHRLFDPTAALPALSADLQRCQTASGHAVDPDVIVAQALTGHIRHVVIGSDQRVTNMGRKQRLFNAAAKEAAALLPTSCSWAGCFVPAELCDTDHVAEWDAEHGPTDLVNATPTCSKHNRWRTQHRYRAKPSRHGTIIQHRPDNSIMHPVGQPRPQPMAERFTFPIVRIDYNDLPRRRTG